MWCPGITLCLLLLSFICTALSGRTDQFGLQPRASSGSGGGPKPPLPSHAISNAPAHGNPSLRLFGVNLTPGHKSTSPTHSTNSRPSHSAQQRVSVSEHSAHSAHMAGARPQTGTKQPGQLSHLVEGLHPIRVDRSPRVPNTHVPGRKPGRPLGSKNKPKSDIVLVKPVRPAKGAKWWNTVGGRPNPPPAADGAGRRYESQKKRYERKKLKQAGNLPDEHPNKHKHHQPGGPGSPGAGSHAVSKRRLQEGKY